MLLFAKAGAIVHRYALSSLFILAAVSSSSTLQLNNYSLGSGGGVGGHSTNYYIEGSSGELQSGATLGSTYQDNSGSLQAQQPNVPLAPSLSNNGGAYYNKLQFIINTSGNPTDTTYSIATSTDNFATTNYVQADGTIGATAVYRTYAQWGGASGSLITGLSSNTTYKVKANALQGMYAASGYGPAASAATATPSLSFSLSANSTNLAALTTGTVTASNANLTYATNGGNGGSVYILGQNGGLKSTSANYTIPSSSMDLTTGQGFGIRSVSASQTSGGPFAAQSPYNNASANFFGGVLTTLQPLYTTNSSTVGASATFSVGAARTAITPAAGDYQEIMTFIAAATF